MNNLRSLRVALLAAAALVAPFALADDLADEADLQFELGAEAYRARDFRVALEHFLSSNRLVANRNVVFNIAKAYEQLTRYADAHRYYSLALSGETDRAALESIRQALGRIAPYVAVLRVSTEPPGATIYIDRRDLGPRGTTPRAMAFAPGRYRVIAELDGYEPATADAAELRLGQETAVALRLTPILGVVRVQSDVPASLRVDDEASAERCVAPCEVQLSPGRHRLFLSAQGYQIAREDVDVVARGSVDARVRMAPITGSVVVSADERDALVEVDGRAMGFTPAVLSVQEGTRRVRISLPGFRPIERVVEVRGGAEARVEVALTRVEEVSAASRTAESVEDAPSSVTIISAQELRAMGYPTIAEAIRGVRGVYLSDDRSYESAGFRGFGRPGDYGNRVLVLLDGHPTNDNWLNSSYIGYDARTDLEDIERIEVVRGPGSVLYGAGAFSGVINLVTRGRGSPNAVETGLSVNQYGVARARIAGRWSNRTAGVWASVGGAYGSGRDFFFPQLVQPMTATTPAVDGYSRDADEFTAGTLTGRAWWRDLTLQWLVHSRDKSIPTGEYDTLLGTPRSNLVDTRGLLELRFEPRISETLQINLRAFGNYYDYRSTLATSTDDAEDGLEGYRGVWTGLEARAVWTPSPAIRLTVGAEGQFHLMADQQSGTVLAPGRDLSQSNRYQIIAGYVSADGSPLSWLRYSAGARVDWYSTLAQPTVNPRVALIFRPYARGNLKVMGGTAFRAPSIYELYYESSTQTRSQNLKPETIYSGEVEFSHRLGTTWTALASGYVNYIRNLVALRQTTGAMGLEQYQNTDAPVLTIGAEAELRREWRQGWMFSASYSFQRSRYLEASGVDQLREVPNSPEHLFSLRASAPVVQGVFIASTRVSVEGPRWDRNDRATDPGQTRTRAALIWDIVASGRAERWGLRYAVGVYNLFDWRYSVPVSAEFGERLTAVPQNGRTFMASTSLEF